MAYIIADPCVGTCDTACVEVCPVDCIDMVEVKPTINTFVPDITELSSA